MDEVLSAEEEDILKDVGARLKGFGKDKGSLIPILQMIQEKHGYLPQDAITMVALYLEISASEVYGVATFYNQFRFHPPGKYPVKVCLGTACHVRAGDIILENFERKLEISEGETTPDREFSIEKVACVEICPVGAITLKESAGPAEQLKKEAVSVTIKNSSGRHI